MAELLEVKNLSVTYRSPRGDVQAVRDVDLSLRPGEVLAVVGESGCGKSALCNAIMRLLPDTASGHRRNSCERHGHRALSRARDAKAARASLFHGVSGPADRAEPQHDASARRSPRLSASTSRKAPREAVSARVEELMELVGIDRAAERMHAYPHQFSGGMRQRAVLAIALAGESANSLCRRADDRARRDHSGADSWTCCASIQQKLGTATMLVSHDLGVVARAADRVAVMYAGRIVEIGTAEEVYYDPRHPYTWALLRALPALARHGEPLYTIPGMPPTLIDPPAGDAFAARNEYALAIDYREAPPMFRITDTHFAATWLLDPRAPKVAPPLGGLRHEG